MSMRRRCISQGIHGDSSYHINTSLCCIYCTFRERSVASIEVASILQSLHASSLSLKLRQAPELLVRPRIVQMVYSQTLHINI